MTFLERVLDPPSYGFLREGKLYIPTKKELFKEFLSHLNIFASKKNWLPFFGWMATLSLTVPLFFFLTHHFSIWLMFAGFIYGMVAMGSHGTFWLHRYCTHRAFRFRSPLIMMICRNLVIRIIPEEIYVVSHLVHHQFSEQPGDPYNVHAGWLYCFLADANHQTIRKDLTEKEYEQLVRIMSITGVRVNSYAQYQRWGSLCHPFFTVLHYALNWSFWYGTFYLLGGHALACALFGWAGIWGFGVRTFNYEGHGKGKDRRREGIDFNWADWSVNQTWPGYVAGEWHNNHHLFPHAAQSGFLPYQLDLPWIFIRGLHSVGAITHYSDARGEFMRNHYLPWKRSKEKPVQPQQTTQPVSQS